MKKVLPIVSVIGVLAFLVYHGAWRDQQPQGLEKGSIHLDRVKSEQRIQSGDLIFQTSKSSQSKAIQLATNSSYSHLGIIFEEDGEQWVYEAVQPVKRTPLAEWISRGANGHYVIKRLKNAEEVLTSTTLIKMKEIGAHHIGKTYDKYFEWSDERMYCSELVWKIYNEATGIRIGELQRLSDFDLSHELVRAKMKERYGDDIPMNEKVISPAAMFNSYKLITIKEK